MLLKRKPASLLGWYGMVAILCAYVLLSLGVIGVRSLLYQGLNFTGAFGLGLETYYRRDYPPMVLNIIWLAVALLALLRTLGGS